MAPIQLVGSPPRYLQEVDIVATTAVTPTDQGIAPLLQHPEFAGLDWRGVRLVEEDWRPEADGTWTLQRFYRGARWMEHSAQFTLQPVGAGGQPLGAPLVAHAGRDDRWQPGDDGFVRRFVVRQIVRGCADLEDLTGANAFSVQGLVQFRDALRADQRARTIPPAATALRLSWSADPGRERTVAVTHADPADFNYGYGFQPQLEVTNLPARGHFLAGEAVQIRVTFRDGQGNRLHPAGALPTYGEFLRGEIESGLRYFDTSLFTTTYYALKHREGNVLLTLSGPVDRLRLPTQTIQLADFFLPQLPVASPATDGYAAAAVTVPPALQIFLPVLWDAPVSDISTLTLPADADQGTYVAAIKARREWGGEALNRATTIEVPVGPQPTTFVAKTGGCGGCHAGPTSFGSVLHGITDRRACFACHGSLAVEPDTALDIRVHMVHGRSRRFQDVGGNVQNCALCHLTPPAGPFRDRGVDGL
jgi:hypothetical protein